jgi:AcrR family transcriptional regulator
MRKSRNKKAAQSSSNKSKSPSAERTAAVLQAAGRLFLERGYVDVSIEMIVGKTGGSNRDLYRDFGGKEELFKRVLVEISNEVLTQLQNVSIPTDDNPLEEIIFSTGQAFMRALLSPRVLAIHRLMVSESLRFPELSETFLKLGPQGAYEAVGEVIKTSFSRENIEIEDPTLTAKLFLDMIAADLQLRSLLGYKISQTEVDERVKMGTRIFLEGTKRLSLG